MWFMEQVDFSSCLRIVWFISEKKTFNLKVSIFLKWNFYIGVGKIKKMKRDEVTIIQQNYYIINN